MKMKGKAPTRACAWHNLRVPCEQKGGIALGVPRCVFPWLAMPACDLQCDRSAGRGRLRCCRKHICDRCVTQVLQLNYRHQRWHIACPFCRRVTTVTAKRVKQMLHDHCPDHAKVLASEIGPVAIVHNPGPDGHYDSQSSISMLPEDLSDIVDELMDEVGELSEDLAAAHAACKTLEEENKRLRQPLLDRRGPFLNELLASSRIPDAVA